MKNKSIELALLWLKKADHDLITARQRHVLKLPSLAEPVNNFEKRGSLSFPFQITKPNQALIVSTV